MRIRTCILPIIALLLAAACDPVRRLAVSETAAEDANWPNLEGIRLSFMPVGYTAAERASWYYLEGIRLAALGGDREGAAAQFRAALAQDSLHAPSLHELASLTLDDDPAAALAYSRAAVALEPDNLWYRQQLGHLYILGERYDSARVVYTRIVDLAPNDPENYRYLAALYEQTGAPEQAVALLDSAELRFGPIDELSFYKRQLLAATGQIDRAIEETVSQVRNLPYDERNFVVLGELYARRGDDSLALDAYNRALALDPANVDALIGINEGYRRAGDALNFLASTRRLFRHPAIPLDTKLAFFGDAIQNPLFYQQYRAAVDELVGTLATAYPDSGEVLDLRVQHRVNSGDIPGALAVAKAALADSASLKAYTWVVDIESYTEHPDSAVMYADRALALYPEATELYLRKGYAQQVLGHYREAERTMEQALARTPSDSVKSTILSSMGDVAHQEDPDNLRRVFGYYDRALALDPDNIHALNNYSYFLSEQERDLDRALVMAERVAELEPGNPTYIDTYGWVLYKLGRLEEAKAALRQAVSLDTGESTELMIHYGDVLYELGEHYMASIYWKKALEKGYDATQIEDRLKRIE